MPLSAIADREEVHHRVIDMKTYARANGLFDAEAHLVDRKPFEFTRAGATDTVAAGEAFHDLWIRVTVDRDFVVRAIEAASDVTPWAVCKQAGAALQALVGEALVKGWTGKVKEKLRGAASCTHLAEMLIPLATTALQGIYGLRTLAEREAKIGAMVDSCYAFGSSRDVIKRLAPLHYQAAVQAYEPSSNTSCSSRRCSSEGCSSSRKR
ncbi:DUF2889 domain-containing protein [Rhodoferax sediminis]|uniref:DUF2889 domain-containing protein n=1 Tax=Rhodoferax sediminis TaxID=2509614 RepID=A0A515DDU4_9BURK|nr:DUF2889 domain-containing protein [Rhodoferax sediminis]QDL38565.1 DUF2889 domain-containing protein [Rhodoferax sediminis]